MNMRAASGIVAAILAVGISRTRRRRARRRLGRRAICPTRPASSRSGSFPASASVPTGCSCRRAMTGAHDCRSCSICMAAAATRQVRRGPAASRPSPHERASPSRRWRPRAPAGTSRFRTSGPTMSPTCRRSSITWLLACASTRHVCMRRDSPAAPACHRSLAASSMRGSRRSRPVSGLRWRVREGRPVPVLTFHGPGRHAEPIRREGSRSRCRVDGSVPDAWRVGHNSTRCNLKWFWTIHRVRCRRCTTRAARATLTSDCPH